MRSHFSRSGTGEEGHDATHEDVLAQATGAATRVSRPLDLNGRVVLLATDASPCADAAAMVAQALAAKYHALVHVVSVVDTRSAPLPPPLDLALAMTDATLAPEVHAEQEAAVRDQLAAVLGQRPEWPIRVALGTPAAAIVHEAKRTGAVLIIVGLRRHGRLDRAMHDETALNVMRHASCAVLGVTEDTRALPTRVLVATDFGESSVIAARACLSVAGADPLLVLAYVASPPTLDPEEGEAVVHDLGVRAAFERVQTELRLDGIRFDHVVLHQAVQRTIAQSLLEYADAMRSDLIAAGSIRRGRFDRWLMGSVSTDLVRDGSRSVLITPPEKALAR